MLNQVLKCVCTFFPGPLPGEAKACQPLHRFPRILGLTGLRGGKVCLFYSQHLFIYSLYLFLSFFHQIFVSSLLFYSPYPHLPPISPFSINFLHFLSSYIFSFIFFCLFSFFQCRYFWTFKSPGNDSKKLILPTFVAWRAGTTILFLLGS